MTFALAMVMGAAEAVPASASKAAAETMEIRFPSMTHLLWNSANAGLRPSFRSCRKSVMGRESGTRDFFLGTLESIEGEFARSFPSPTGGPSGLKRHHARPSP